MNTTVITALYLLNLYLIISLPSHTQELKNKQIAVVSGIIQGSNNQALILHIGNYDFINEEIQSHRILTGKDGSFSHSIHIEHKMVQRLKEITLITDTQEVSLLNGEYLLEPGDSIVVDIRSIPTGYNINFTGRGSAKYHLELKLNDISSRNHQKLNYYYNEKILNVDSLKNICRISVDSILALKYFYEKTINPTSLNIMIADHIGGTYSNITILNALHQIGQEKGGLRKPTLSFLRGIHWDADSFPDSIILMSRNYQIYLLQRTRYQLTAANSKKSVTLKDIYYQQKRNFIGKIREALLILTLKSIANAAFRSEQKDSAILLWKDAAKIIETPFLKDYATRRATYKTKGNKVIDFTMEDTAGRQVKLSDLRGKVVFMNVWFTGCTSCIRFHRMLEKCIYPEFGNEADLIFLNISADTNRNTWKSSIASGQYTRSEDLNLFSNGRGFEHPFLQYYEFQSSGESLLLDRNGTIFASRLPHHDMKALADIIKSALNNKQP
jgi:Thiol-disulfide isomerase and thioredoxins